MTAVKGLVERLNEYLANGGLFNPELMDHAKVRDLIVDVRDTLAALSAEQGAVATGTFACPVCGGTTPHTKAHHDWLAANLVNKETVDALWRQLSEISQPRGFALDLYQFRDVAVPVFAAVLLDAGCLRSPSPRIAELEAALEKAVPMFALYENGVLLDPPIIHSAKEDSDYCAEGCDGMTVEPVLIIKRLEGG